MDLPPPSQSQAPKSTLFSNADGTPIRVFTQADLQGRNRVLKDLRVCFVPIVMFCSLIGLTSCSDKWRRVVQ